MQTAKRKQVLSGIQPTGNLHLGRYFGAIRNWVDLQKDYDCIYSVVNYHAMTMPFKPKELREQTWDVVFDLIAVGVKPENIFIHSMIPEHTELGWIFNCVSSYGDLQRMTQFKDKSQQVSERDKDAFISTGLFTYPVLQAADILIYKADFVPVGKDQDQHLELTRSIAQKFNQVVGKEYFILPRSLHTNFPKVMSTADPSKKMSASLGPKHFINVFSPPEIIRKQIQTAVTDIGFQTNEENTWVFAWDDWEIENELMVPLQISLSSGVSNLFQMLIESGGRPYAEELGKKLLNGEKVYGKLKEAVANQIIQMTDPFREKRKEISNNSNYFRSLVMDSSVEIRKKAIETLYEVKELIGLVNVI